MIKNKCYRVAMCAALLLFAVACKEDASKPKPKPIVLTAEVFETLELDLSKMIHRRAKQSIKTHKITIQPRGTNANIRRLYTSNTPLWVGSQPEPLSAKGQALMGVLRDAVALEGISAATLALPQLETLSTQTVFPTQGAIQLTKADRQKIAQWVKRHPRGASMVDYHGELSIALLSKKTPVKRLLDVQEARNKAFKSALGQRAMLDVQLTQSMLRYASINHLNNDAWLKHLTFPESLVSKSKSVSASLLKRRKAWYAKQVVDRLVASKDDTTLRKHLTALRPPFEAYKRLMKAHKRYVQIEAKGGWPAVPSSLIGKKGDHADLPILRKRLKTEGLYEGKLSSTKRDDALNKAMALYQTTHQLAATDHVTKTMWRSLNVPVHRRLMEIRLALAKWRASAVGGDPYYIRVNIADFHAEVWKSSKRLWRTRVVTGSHRRKYDRKQRKWTMPQQTARFSDTLKYLVFRPYWNVPETILNDELLPKLKEEPDYFEKNNFEWVTVSETRKYVRQKPGGDNALGQVKFLFPNPHDIYMHDTPQKAFFDRPVRAYSHGCVRVEHPMELAKLLLEQEKRWNPKQTKAWLAKPSETWVTLKQGVPVHLEYVVARVDKMGHVHFLTDVYKLDREALTQHMADDRASELLQRAMHITHPKPKSHTKKRLARK